MRNDVEEEQVRKTLSDGESDSTLSWRGCISNVSFFGAKFSELSVQPALRTWLQGKPASHVQCLSSSPPGTFLVVPRLVAFLSISGQFESVILRKARQTDTEGGVSAAYGHLQPSAEEFGHSGGMGHL